MASHPQTIIVIGGSGGIGRALIDALLARYSATRIFASYYQAKQLPENNRLSWQALDIRNPLAIDAWASDFKRVDWIINAAGYLHGRHGGPEKSIRSFDPEFMLENIRVNTLPTLLLAQSFAAALKQARHHCSPPCLRASAASRITASVAGTVIAFQRLHSTWL